MSPSDLLNVKML